MWVCDLERTPSTAVWKMGNGTRALWINWRGPGVYSRVPCADPVLLATPHHRGQPLPGSGGGPGGELVSASAHPNRGDVCVGNLTPFLALPLEKISLCINISRDHKRPTEPERTLQALLMVVCSEVSPSGQLGAGRQQGGHSEALRGHGLDPSRLNKRTWNEQRLPGLRDGHSHPGSARDGSPSRRRPPRMLCGACSHYSLVDVSLFMPLR